MAEWRDLMRRNRVVVCPECGGRLGSDRDAVTTENRFIYRTRPCKGCGILWHTKQAPEEATGYDPAGQLHPDPGKGMGKTM